MTLDAFISFLHGPGLVMLAAGWLLKVCVGYGGLRWWRARRVALRVPAETVPVVTPEAGQ